MYQYDCFFHLKLSAMAHLVHKLPLIDKPPNDHIAYLSMPIDNLILQYFPETHECTHHRFHWEIQIKYPSHKQ